MRHHEPHFDARGFCQCSCCVTREGHCGCDDGCKCPPVGACQGEDGTCVMCRPK